MLLTRLGIERLWGGGPEGSWAFMRYWVRPATMWLAPGSCGYGLDRVPAAGGAVLAATHLSAIDPPLIGSFSRRAIWYMMKLELAEIPVLGEAPDVVGRIPDPARRERPRRAPACAGARPQRPHDRHLPGGDAAAIRASRADPAGRRDDLDVRARADRPVRHRVLRLVAEESPAVLRRLW